MAKRQVKKIEYAPSARQRKQAERAKNPRAETVTEQRTAVSDGNASATSTVNATVNVVAAEPAQKKKKIVLISVVSACVAVLLILAILLICFPLQVFGIGNRAASVTFRLDYRGSEYAITYELEEVDTASDNLGEAVASFVSWTNKGVYDDSVLHKFDADSGCLEGGRYVDYNVSSASGTRIMTFASTKDTVWQDYYYAYNATSNKDKKIASKYNLSVMPYSGTSTYRWDFRLCVRDGKTNLDSLTGYVIGTATDGSRAVVDRLFEKIEEEVLNGVNDLTPVIVKSVKIGGSRGTKWTKYDFFSDHAKDGEYKRLTY